MNPPKVGDWCLMLSSDKDMMMMGRGWRIFRLAIFKWKKIPDAGGLIGKENYRGIHIHFAYWLPFESV